VTAEDECSRPPSGIHEEHPAVITAGDGPEQTPASEPDEQPRLSDYMRAQLEDLDALRDDAGEVPYSAD
jgi:hypothetical protein